MKIALLDLNHMTMGVHTNTTPLGIGLIARYLKLNINCHTDIKLFKDPLKFQEALKSWVPEVLGIAQYSWNSELNLCMARLVKKINGDCIIVAGGPDLYLTHAEKRKYLSGRREIDICVSHDGEIPFLEIVKAVESGYGAGRIRMSPPLGCYAYDLKKKIFMDNSEPSPRLASLDVFGSIYADGWFDNLLDSGFHPFLQTHRGCPFSCVYCHTSLKYCSKMLFQSPFIFEADLEYLGRRYAGKHNVTLYLANTNFGLFKEDFDIARVIRKIQDKYDWPKNIFVNSGKDPDKLLKIMSLLKYKFIPYISLQTLTPRVLKNIKRKNIPFREFVKFQKDVTVSMGNDNTTELILSLPGETRKSFLKTLKGVLDSGVQNIVIYTLMSLKGTPLSEPSFAKRYGHIIRHRIMPRCFSEISGDKILESEEVVVGTKYMPLKDYFYLRKLALIATTFAASFEMYPVRKLLLENNKRVSDWIFGIHDNITDYPNLKSSLELFIKETKGELFPSRSKLVKFFNRDDNYKMLRDGRFGDNLLRKYKTIIISRYYDDFSDLGLRELKRLLVNVASAEGIASDLREYLVSRDIGHIFKSGYGDLYPKKAMLKYDVPRWLSDKSASLKLRELRGKHDYEILVTDYSKKRLGGFISFKRDPDLSLQIIYRDGYIRDFWPEWIRRVA